MDFKGFFQRAYDWLAGLGKYIKKIVLDIMTDAVKDFINRMGPDIEVILKEIQADPALIVNEERRQAAFDRILEAAKKHGIDTVQESVVYMAIEMILNALKNTGELGENVGAKSTKAKSTKKNK